MIIWLAELLQPYFRFPSVRISLISRHCQHSDCAWDLVVDGAAHD